MSIVTACASDDSPGNDSNTPQPTSQINTNGGSTGGSTGNSTPPEGAAPMAIIDIDALQGIAPLTVHFDASQSHDDDTPSSDLQVRWDFDGDQDWDSEFTLTKTATHIFSVPGTFTPRLEVRDPEGHAQITTAHAPIVVSAPGVEQNGGVNINADTNRDGFVTDADDVANENIWAAERGAIFLANLDDDNDDGRRDAQDSVVNGDDDLLDMAPLMIRQMSDLQNADTVALHVEPATTSTRVRFFRYDASTQQWNVLPYTSGGDISLPHQYLTDSDLQLKIEGQSTRSANWDGRVTVSVTLSRNNTVANRDSVQLRVAPVILPDDTHATEMLYVMRIVNRFNEPNTAYYNALTGQKPNDIPLYAVNETAYGADRWVQDNMQTGYQEFPSSNGPHVMHLFVQLERATGSQGLERLVPNELLAANLGYVYPGGTETSHNYGGNLEVIPSHAGYPFGRIVTGGGHEGTLFDDGYEDHMAQAQINWMNAQEAQGQSIEVSSEWLYVGHIDEIFLFVPDRNVVRNKNFKVVIASPARAIAALRDLSTQGRGSTAIFAGRDTATTVNAVLGNSELLAFNQAAQIRIDSIRNILKNQIGLVDDDFYELPVMYEPVEEDGGRLAIALNPGMQNLVIADDVAFIPDPEGPADANGDVWKRGATTAMQPLGLRQIYVDVFNSYHLLMGEAHCGTNFIRAPYTGASWER